MADFKTILIKKRKELGLSQKEMAEYLHVTRQAISKWENGKSMPDMATLPDVAELLGVSVDELLTGKEPEKQIVERVVEKEVVKPMPTFKILSIVLPIVMVVILAAVLMGIYIPREIAKRTPPAIVIPEPEPEIVYTDVFLQGKSNSDDSRFHADPIKDKAYFDLNMQYSSEYSLYINAPKGAVATLNDEVIAEFDDAETKVYTQYFNFKPLVEVNNNIIINDTTYHVVVDLTNCEERRKIEGAWIVIKQRTGFDGVVIPAHGEYFVALNIPEEVGAWHYKIKSAGIVYNGTWATDKVQEYNSTKIDPYSGYDKRLTEFYFTQGNFIDRKTDRYFDRQIEFLNITNNDIELELEEIPIEEIQVGQEITLNPTDNWVGDSTIIIYKLHLDAPKYLLTEFRYNGDYSFNSSKYWDDSDCTVPDNQYPSYRQGWYVNAMYHHYGTKKLEGEVYILIYIGKDKYDKPKKFVIDDESSYLLRQAQYEQNQQS